MLSVRRDCLSRCEKFLQCINILWQDTSNQSKPAYNIKDLALSALGNLTRMLKYFERVIALNLNDYNAYYNNDLSLPKLNNFTGAFADYDNTLRISPKNKKTYWIIGTL